MPDEIPSIPGVDIAGTLERLGLEYEDLRGILETLPGSMRASLADIDKAVAAGDSDAVRHAAHTLSGLSGNFGAIRVQPAAKAVEIAARENRPGDFAALVTTLRPLVEEAAGGLEKVL